MQIRRRETLSHQRAIIHEVCSSSAQLDCSLFDCKLLHQFEMNKQIMIKLFQAEERKNCYVKLSKLKKTTPKIVLDEQSCHCMNLLSFTLKLLSFQLDIFGVIQEPM